MTIKSSSVWPVNELGEVVAQVGSGTNTVIGYVSIDQVPADVSSGRFPIKFPDLDVIVMGEPLTGFVAGAGTVTATDTVLQAFNKIVGNITLKATNILTGFVSGAGTVVTTDTILQAIQKLDGNTNAKAAIDNASFTGITTTQAIIKNTRVVTAAGAITVLATDNIIIVNKAVGDATAVNLPASPAVGREITIKDGKADAATNNITLTPASGNIDGLTTYVMNANRQAVSVVYDGAQWEIT